MVSLYIGFPIEALHMYDECELDYHILLSYLKVIPNQNCQSVREVGVHFHIWCLWGGQMEIYYNYFMVSISPF